MKRLVANDATDSLFNNFKALVSLNDIANHLHDVYESWSNASVKNMIDEHYGDFGHWFDQYYSAIINDCLGQANEDIVFHDKYMSLPVENHEGLKSLISDYIVESKDELQNMLTLGIQADNSKESNEDLENDDMDNEEDNDNNDENIDMDEESFDFDFDVEVEQEK